MTAWAPAREAARISAPRSGPAPVRADTRCRSSSSRGRLAGAPAVLPVSGPLGVLRVLSGLPRLAIPAGVRRRLVRCLQLILHRLDVQVPASRSMVKSCLGKWVWLGRLGTLAINVRSASAKACLDGLVPWPRRRWCGRRPAARVRSRAGSAERWRARCRGSRGRQTASQRGQQAVETIGAHVLQVQSVRFPQTSLLGPGGEHGTSVYRVVM